MRQQHGAHCLALRKQMDAGARKPECEHRQAEDDEDRAEALEAATSAKSATEVLCQGTMRKLCSVPPLGRVWRVRYFSLFRAGLAYFRASDAKRNRARGIFRVSSRTVCTVLPLPGQQWPGGTGGEDACYCIVVRDVQRELRVLADNAVDTQRWYRALSDHIHALGGPSVVPLPAALDAIGNGKSSASDEGGDADSAGASDENKDNHNSAGDGGVHYYKYCARKHRSSKY